MGDQADAGGPEPWIVLHARYALAGRHRSLRAVSEPGAIVTSPTAATIRYAGPLLDFGNVVILEPQAQTLFVLAGLDVVYGEAGQVIAAQTPIGLMGGAVAQGADELSPLREGSGTERSETLYMEVRTDNTPQNPEEWFRTDKDG